MNKILTFIVNQDNKLLLLKGSPDDSQFKKSFWYVVAGGCEAYDKTKEDTIIREIKEETGIKTVNDIKYLNWILKYNSLGEECVEYVYITFVKNEKIVLNEENIDYKWCDLEEFINKIHWFSNKERLTKVLELAINKKVYFDEEFVEEIK